MPLFADVFWSDNMTKGLETLFAQMHEGFHQNELFIQLFRSRMQDEVAYGTSLCKIRSGIDSFDEKWSTVNMSLAKILSQMEGEGNDHIVIGSKIESTVLIPFSKWTEEHCKRVEYSESLLKKSLMKFTNMRKNVEQLEQLYFNKCRAFEDFKRKNFYEDKLSDAMRALELQKKCELLSQERESLEFCMLGSISLTYKSTRKLVARLLTELEKQDYKVPFIKDTFQNTNNGSEITRFVYKHSSLTDIDACETFGQKLLDRGVLKCCNGVSGNFVDSKEFQYQWTPYAYEFARVIKPWSEDSDHFSSPIHEITTELQSGAIVPEFSEEERTLLKLSTELEAADTVYRNECIKLDSLRCSLEELLVDHYTFMEKCESDRLAAIKKVTLDFCAILGDKISSIKLVIEKMIESENLMDPIKDMLELVKRHRTGVFQPKVIPYNNYYNPAEFQVFGIDIETRCCLDKKTVPLVVSTILSYMDHIYPELSNDEERTKVWIAPVKLHETHHLRKLLNFKSLTTEAEILEIINSTGSTPSLVTSILKLYLLELPTPLISDEIYHAMKSLYIKFPSILDGSNEVENQKDIDLQRIKSITDILAVLSKPRIATLDAITTHFHRLIKILKMSNSETSESLANELALKISQEFANCIIDVKVSDGNDLGFKLFFDLITYKKFIFDDLKRQASRQASKQQ